MTRASIRSVLTVVLLATLASCANSTSAAPGQHLWTIRANWDGNGPAAFYDSYANLVITLTSTDSSQDVGSAADVTALDPSTGRRDWSIVTDETPQLAMFAKGFVFVATSGPAESAISPNGGPPSVLVLDDRSGTEIRNINMAAGATALGLTRGTIVASDEATLYGYSPLTGVETWRWRPPEGCNIHQSAASAVVASVLTDCRNGNVILTSVNPASGTALWSRTVGYYDSQPIPNQPGGDVNPYGISAQGNFISVTSAGSASIFSATGVPLDSEQSTGDEQPFMTNRNDHLFIVYVSTAGDLTVKDLDTAGPRLPDPSQPAVHADLGYADGRHAVHSRVTAVAAFAGRCHRRQHRKRILFSYLTSIPQHRSGCLAVRPEHLRLLYSKGTPSHGRQPGPRRILASRVRACCPGPRDPGRRTTCMARGLFTAQCQHAQRPYRR